MADSLFNKREQAIMEWASANGKTGAEARDAIVRFRRTGSPVDTSKPVEQPQSRLKETFGDIKETFTGVGEELFKAGESVQQTLTDPRFSDPNRTTLDKVVAPLEQLTEIGADFFRGGSRALGEGVIGLGKVALSQEQEEGVKEGFQKAVQPIAESQTVQNVVQKYQALPEDQKQQLDNILGFGEGLADILTVGTAKRVISPVIDAITSATKKGVRTGVETGTGVFGKVKSLFTRPARSVDDVIEQADQAIKDSPSAIRETAEQGAVQPNLKEKFIGLTPDIKKRIQQAGPEKLQEYIDVVNARNIDDTVPTPYEYGGQRVQDAVDELYKINNETGSAIGQTRQKLATVQAPATSVQVVDNAFREGLEKLNLTIRNGQIIQKPGTIAKTGAAGDIKVLNDLYAEFLKFKQSPTLRNMIDLRSLVDGKINFAKGAREASNSVDPFSRSFRASLADEAAKLVGKTGAGDLARYSEFMDALATLESYTGRKAGGEYLLRLVLSGRGGDARKIIATVKELTGIDLMNDATLMTVVTDLLGNKNTKNLFRQEITSAGFDALRALSGDPKGAMNILGDYLQRKFLDEETILKEAAESPLGKGVTPAKLNIGDDLATEARKFNTAEEFVEAQIKQDKILVRGDSGEAQFGDPFDSVYFTKDLSIAEGYKVHPVSGKVGEIKYINANEVKIATEADLERLGIRRYIKDERGIGQPNKNLDTQLKEAGFDGIDESVQNQKISTDEVSEIRIWNKEKVKQKPLSQLTEIWNKANN